MSVLVFRHSTSCPAGRLAWALDAHGIEWRYVDLWELSQEEIPVDQAQAIVSLGGPMSAYDSLPFLRREERWLTSAISSGVPVLGICLGAQILARCLGSPVRAMGYKELGWRPVQLDDAALEDPLLGCLRRTETVFQWHGDTFDLPAGCVKLAASELCANQAFRYGPRCYGVQFHPEVTPEIIAGWCDEDAACGAQREAESPIDPAAYRDQARRIADHIFGRWCEMVEAG